jgi:post-segregation antitoxin (ccd killing protein)
VSEQKKVDRDTEARLARDEAARRWYEENKEAVDSYNELVVKYGLFSDGGARMF